MSVFACYIIMSLEVVTGDTLILWVLKRVAKQDLHVGSERLGGTVIQTSS